MSVNKSAYLIDSYKWRCDSGCDGDIHSKGCSIRRKALANRYFRLRYRIICNRRHSFDNLRKTVEAALHLVAKWAYKNEQLEIELRAVDDACFLAGIELDDIPEQYDPLSSRSDNIEATQNTLEEANEALRKVIYDPPDEDEAVYNLAKAEAVIGVPTAKAAVQRAINSYNALRSDIEKLWAPLEERDCVDIFSEHIDIDTKRCLTPSISGTFWSNTRRYMPTLSVSIPKFPHTLRYLEGDETEALLRKTEFVCEGKIKKVTTFIV